MPDSPRVTVLMAVYNGERFLRLAIESVLNQTFTDFELLIVDDASTDSTPAIVCSYHDPHIRMIHNERNGGAGFARNMGLHNARGEYVAVLDADDVAYPQRLAEQVAFLDKHLKIALVGSAHELIDENGVYMETVYHPTEPLAIHWALLFGNCISTSSVMFRKNAALQVGGFYSRRASEDFNLWSQLATSYQLAQIEKPLVAYRYNSAGLSQMNSRSGILVHNSTEVVQQNLQSLLHENIPLQVAGCLRGNIDYFDNRTVDQAYAILWNCLMAFVAEYTISRSDRRHLLQAAFTELLRLARRSEIQRLQSVKIAVRFGIRYVPECLLAPSFHNFALRILVPARLRHVISSARDSAGHQEKVRR